MSQEVQTPHDSPQSAAQPIYEIWIDALIKPNVETYHDIGRHPNASAMRGFLWLFLAYLISTLVSVMGAAFLGSLSAILGDQSLGATPGFAGLSGLSMLCIAPLGAVLGVLVLAAIAGISHLIARAVGGTGSFGQLVYAFAAYMAPLTIVSSMLGVVPLLNCVTIPLGFYGLFLNILAIKAVHDISWGKALLSSVVVIAGIMIFVAVFVIVILALLGPAIGNVFSNIIEEIGTPVP